MSIQINSITPHIGAEVFGIDLGEDLSDEQFGEIRQAFLDWKVLVFREQHISQDAHKAFAKRFGTIHTHPLAANYGGDPEILRVKTTADSPYTAGDGWHTDVTCDELPPMGSMLYVTETPDCGGGDTLYADMYLAYEMLSKPMQSFLETLTAVHDGAKPYLGSYKMQPKNAEHHPRTEHPVVISHPETGRKVLFVNAGFTTHIKGLRPQESNALLDMLYRHIESTPKLRCHVNWQPNTLTFWDNRCTQHHAVWDYYPHSRYGERVSIIGARPSQ